jgi:hypothetical protein
VNGVHLAFYGIQRGVRQGWPLAPYLFFVIGEVVNMMVKKEVAQGSIKGILLPGRIRQQVIT